VDKAQYCISSYANDAMTNTLLVSQQRKPGTSAFGLDKDWASFDVNSFVA